MVLERLHEYIDARGMTIASFEMSAGMSNAAFRKALQSGKGIGSDKLENILSIYTDLSAEWLFRGSGEMLVSTETPIGDHIKQQVVTENIGKIDGGPGEIFVLRKEAEMLREQLREVKERNDEYWKIIVELVRK